MEAVIGPWQFSIQRAWPDSDQLAQMYDTAAPTWHGRLGQLGYVRAYTKLFSTLRDEGVFDHFQAEPAVLDCGVGTGAFSLALTQAISPNINLFGLDLSKEMVQKAAALFHRAEINAQIRQGDINTLPFDDSSFDLVVSAHMLEHLPDPAAGLREMIRVLRPGSPLILSVSRPGLLSTLIQWRWRNSTFEAQAMVDILTEIGLTQIQTRPLAVGLSRWTSVAYVGIKQ